MLHCGVAITAEDVQAMLADYGLTPVAGDVAVFYTGWQHMQYFDPAYFLSCEPGPDADAFLYLAEFKIAAIGGDSVGTEVFFPNATETAKLPAEINRTLPSSYVPHSADPNCPDNGRGCPCPPGACFPMHVAALFLKGVFNLKNLDLEQLALDSVREGLFVLGAAKSPTPQVGLRRVHRERAIRFS